MGTLSEFLPEIEMGAHLAISQTDRQAGHFVPEVES
jgi:hypothetical protein